VTLGVLVLASRIAHASGMLLKEHSIGIAGVASTYFSEVVLSLWVVVNALRAI
jgi:uncharacterized membrane protein YecN with MAPEG domain